MEKNNSFATIEEAIADFKQGKMLLVVDDEDRENEGDLIVSAQAATPAVINFMASKAKGLICAPISKEIAERLDLGPVVQTNTESHCTAFTVGIDHLQTSTGISAYDRSVTAQALSNLFSKPNQFRRPGHLFPLVAVEGGTLIRMGHTEATVDFCKLAGLQNAGLCCEIMNDDGTMARLPKLQELAKEWNIKLVTIASLIKYRKLHEEYMSCVAKAKLPTKYGMFTLHEYVNQITGAHHEALVMGDISSGEKVLCRVHSECATGDIFGSIKCDCGKQYEEAMKKIAVEKRGVLIYMHQEGRGIGLVNKIRAYQLQDEGLDTIEANLRLGLPSDARDYYESIHMLKDLGISSVRLMTNNPLKINALNVPEVGLSVCERVSLEVAPVPQSLFYLQTKQLRMGHLISNLNIKEAT